MLSFNFQPLRDFLAVALNELHQEQPVPQQEYFSIEKIDEILNVINSVLASNNEKARSELSLDLNVSVLGIATLSMVTMVIDNPQETLDIFLPTNSAHPNFVLRCLLTNIVNNTIGILKLLEAGLNTPASVVLRNTLELSWLTIVIAYDEDKMKSYAGDIDHKEERKRYNQHFAAKKLVEKLAEIELKLGLDSEATNDLGKKRDHAYGYYSRIVHGSYISQLFGAFDMENQEDKKQWYIFGSVTLDTQRMIYELNMAIFYLITSLIRILIYKNILQKPHNQKWTQVLACYDCYSSSFFAYARNVSHITRND
jgi:hypothetical protein